MAVSNGAAPSILLEVDRGISTLVVQSNDRQPMRGGSAPELQRSVSDSAETTMSSVLLMQTACGTRSAVSLVHDLSKL